MNSYGLTFHHFGLAVRKPEKASNFLVGLGYSIGPTVRDELQNVSLIYCTHAQMPAVEIIFPTETAGPLEALLSAHNELIYHLCFEASCLEDTLRAISEQGSRALCISPPKPAVLFGGLQVSFYRVSGVGVIEILERAAQ